MIKEIWSEAGLRVGGRAQALRPPLVADGVNRSSSEDSALFSRTRTETPGMAAEYLQGVTLCLCDYSALCEIIFS